MNGMIVKTSCTMCLQQAAFFTFATEVCRKPSYLPVLSEYPPLSADNKVRVKSHFFGVMNGKSP